MGLNLDGKIWDEFRKKNRDNRSYNSKMKEFGLNSDGEIWGEQLIRGDIFEF